MADWFGACVEKVEDQGAGEEERPRQEVKLMNIAEWREQVLFAQNRGVTETVSAPELSHAHAVAGLANSVGRKRAHENEAHGHGSAQLFDGLARAARVYVYGGFAGSGTSCTNHASSHSTGQWTIVGMPPAPTTVSGSDPSRLNPEGRISKNACRRSRASRRTQTTLFYTNITNFRAMVQQFTGDPSSPFAAAPRQANLNSSDMNLVQRLGGK